MINSGCTADGSLNESKFNDPMPWIGIYVAAASLACAIAMAIDALHGFKYKKFWFPCKFFSLNATTLTLIGIGIKFSMDLNAAMPHLQDQLAKVSSSAFICTVMGNLLPSLGSLEDTELLMNIVALAILVITAVVNICIQMRTGVIFVFWIEHGTIMLLMVILLAILCSLSLAIPATKYYLDIEYGEKMKIANKECSNKRNLSVSERLREDLGKYWMMAYTSSPQFVIGRLAPCTASGIFCLLSTLILAEAILRSHLMPWSFKFCNGESDYKRSTTVVLISQTIAVGVGTISPAFRLLTAINFRCPEKAKRAGRKEFVIEAYWIKKLLLWQVQPLELRICGRLGRKLAQGAKHKIFCVFISLQKGIVFSCKMIRFVSIFFVGRFLILKRVIQGNNSDSRNGTVLQSQNNLNTNLSRFVIHLEGEEELVELITENNCDSTSHWIRMGEEQQPSNLMKLLEKSNSTWAFGGVREFDSDKIQSLGSAEPPNSWALPIVTLTSIAVALPTIDGQLNKQLVRSVHEGLKYVRVIENSLDEKEDLKHARKTAEIVWSGVELFGKWIDVDLCKMALEQKGGTDIIKKLANISKEKFMSDMIQKNEFLKEFPSRWPIRALAANSMYRICETILLGPETRQEKSSQRLFENLSLMISNIFTAAFTNLQHVIHNQCSHSRIEEREQNIRCAILLFGRTEKILKVLDQKTPEDSELEQPLQIDDWHLLHKHKSPPHSVSSSTEKESAVYSKSDLYISVE